jgi:hypothetical protein
MKEKYSHIRGRHRESSEREVHPGGDGEAADSIGIAVRRTGAIRFPGGLYACIEKEGNLRGNDELHTSPDVKKWRGGAVPILI